MKIPEHLSREYFFSRSLKCQWGALLSQQSHETTEKNRELLLQEIKENYEKDVSPEYDHSWGGYIIVPYKIEFWQGKESRLHDRYVFSVVDSFLSIQGKFF